MVAHHIVADGHITSQLSVATFMAAPCGQSSWSKAHVRHNVKTSFSALTGYCDVSE